MSNKDIDHKQLIVAKCYELALLDCRDGITEAFIEFSDPPTTMIDDVAMGYLDRIMKAADIWKGS
jgi:hypothetical protein